MLVSVKIWDCHRNRLRAGLAVCMPLTSLTGRCGRIVTLTDENRGTSGVRSPDELSNKSRTTSCRWGSSGAVWVLSGGIGFSTIYDPVPRPLYHLLTSLALRHLSCGPGPPIGRALPGRCLCDCHLCGDRFYFHLLTSLQHRPLAPLSPPGPVHSPPLASSQVAPW